MRVVYSERYRIDIGPHVFPTEKYHLVCQRLLASGVIGPSDVVEPREAGDEELALVHTPDYLRKVTTGTLDPEEIAGLELPWSEAMVRGFRLMVGGTIDAACLACGVARSSRSPQPERHGSAPADGIVCHIGGGLHHAFPDHGEGFCPFNDVAVAARVLRQRGLDRIAVVDLDVHQGNGTAFTFNPRGLVEPVAPEGVFTFSMHQQHNYPVWKPRGSLDVGLPDGCHDSAYLRELQRALPKVMAFRPQCVFYLAGADPFEEDQLGGLRLTRAGLAERDRLVVETVRRAGLPLVMTLAGGYARRIEDTVAIHAASIEQAARALARAS
jgi:acetoin utilization deacetylase AcuC-like enzyme